MARQRYGMVWCRIVMFLIMPYIVFSCSHVTRADEESLAEEQPVEGTVPCLVHLGDGVDRHFQLE